jgi:hypothetical protein
MREAKTTDLVSSPLRETLDKLRPLLVRDALSPCGKNDFSTFLYMQERFPPPAIKPPREITKTKFIPKKRLGPPKSEKDLSLTSEMPHELDYSDSEIISDDKLQSNHYNVISNLKAKSALKIEPPLIINPSKSEIKRTDSTPNNPSHHNLSLNSSTSRSAMVDDISSKQISSKIRTNFTSAIKCDVVIPGTIKTCEKSSNNNNHGYVKNSHRNEPDYKGKANSGSRKEVGGTNHVSVKKKSSSPKEMDVKVIKNVHYNIKSKTEDESSSSKETEVKKVIKNVHYNIKSKTEDLATYQIPKRTTSPSSILKNNSISLSPPKIELDSNLRNQWTEAATNVKLYI